MLSAVQSVCNNCFVQLWDIKRAGQFLTCDDILVANALIISKLDNCNSFFQKSLKVQST